MPGLPRLEAVVRDLKVSGLLLLLPLPPSFSGPAGALNPEGCGLTFEPLSSFDVDRKQQDALAAVFAVATAVKEGAVADADERRRLRFARRNGSTYLPLDARNSTEPNARIL